MAETPKSLQTGVPQQSLQEAIAPTFQELKTGAAENVANNPLVPTRGADYYNEFKKQIDMGEPGLPEWYRDKVATERASARLQAEQQAEAANSAALLQRQNSLQQVQDSTNQLKAQLGVIPQQLPKKQEQPQVQKFENVEAQTSVPESETSNVAAPYNSQSVQQRQAQVIADATKDKIFNETAIANERMVALEKEKTKQEEFQKTFNDDWKQKASEMDSIVNQMKDFQNAKVDNTNFWSSKSTGDKILGGIAIALGGIGGAFTGKGGNAALDIINKAIDRDIETQKFNLKQQSENLKDRLGANQTILSSLRAKFNDDLAAEAALRAMNIEIAANKLKSISAASDSKIVQANANILISKLEEEKRQNLQTAQIRSYMLKKSAAGERLSPVEVASIPDENLRKAIIADQELKVNGWQGMAKDKESASKFETKVVELQPTIDILNEIINYSKNGKNWSPEKRAELKVKLEFAKGKLRIPLQGPGAMTDSDRAQLDKVLENPDNVFAYTPAAISKLKSAERAVSNELKTVADVYGFRKVEPLKSVPGLKPR